MFKEIAPYVITATVIICILIAIKIKKQDILTTDGIFSVAGFVLGLFITSLNLIHSNQYMISLGPLLAITCLLYLRFRDKILTNGPDFNLNFSSKTLKIINILYWVCISVAIINYYQAPPYYRPPIFFIGISLGVALLGLEIISSKFKDNYTVFGMISKILLISLILRACAYFISPYPIGSDVWVHAEYIKDFLSYHHLMSPQYSGLWGKAACYTKYPLAHLLVCAANLIGNISIKESMFILGAVLTLSTIFVYLIVKKVTGSVNLALFSMLLLNFADFHIEWAIGPIAMTFGIAIYAILLYLLLKRNEKHWLFYISFSILFLFVITWTHTVASYIALISVISLYIGSFVYHAIYGKHKYEELLVSLTLCMVFIVVLVTHWTDPDYPFFEAMVRGIVDALSQEAEFLGRETPLYAVEHGEMILNILGFLLYIFFGIIGSLYGLSRKYADKTKVSFIFMLIVLYFVFFIFPVLGLRNIVPYRWPAFIYVSFVLFVGIGLTAFLSILKSKKEKIVFLLFVVFITSFLSITAYIANTDSLVYGKDATQRMCWTTSEVTLFKNVNKSYNGVIIADSHTSSSIFKTHLKREKTGFYPLTPKEDVDWNPMNDMLVIWRKISLTRPVQGVLGEGRPDILLGNEFKNHLDNNFHCISDTGEARAYL